MSENLPPLDRHSRRNLPESLPLRDVTKPSTSAQKYTQSQLFRRRPTTASPQNISNSSPTFTSSTKSASATQSIISQLDEDLEGNSKATSKSFDGALRKAPDFRFKRAPIPAKLLMNRRVVEKRQRNPREQRRLFSGRPFTGTNAKSRVFLPEVEPSKPSENDRENGPSTTILKKEIESNFEDYPVYFFSQR